MFTYSARTAATTIAVTAVVMISVVAPARAQDGVQNKTEQQLLACDVIVDLTEKLTCFNVIVENLKKNLAATDSAATIAPATVATSVIATPAPTVEVDSLPPTAVSSAPAVATVAATTNVDDFGRETVKVESDPIGKEGKKAESIQATIVDVWKTADQRFAIELDNGQIWRETSGSRIAMPKKGRAVEISKGRFGGYRMKVEKIKRLASVRRTK